jgi:CubicO group peptidase (beta-lactamase class C family)
MQLAERQRINLDGDVNSYLKRLKINEPFAPPITLRHLLTHTAGFDSDQREIGGSARDDASWLPLDAYVARRSLTSLWPPGQRFVYSNAAYDLLGLVVEDVTGRAYEDYLADRILQPLDMQRSGFSFAAASSEELARSYHYSDGHQNAIAVGRSMNAPAAGLVATATDISHFMLAHLHDGSYDGRRILEAATAQEMHQEHFTYAQDQPGMAYGFRLALSPSTMNGARDPPPSGTRVLWHAGGGPRASSSYLELLPEDGLGLFLAFNSDESNFLDDVLSAFDAYYLPSSSPPEVTALGSSDLSPFTGIYRSTEYSHTTIAKLQLLETDDLPRVIVTNNRLGIRWLSDAPGEPEPLRQVAPLVFTNQDGRFRFTFLQDGNGEVRGMVWGNLFELEKVPPFETVAVQRTLFGGFFLLFAAVTIGVPIVARVRRVRPVAILAWFTALLNIAFLVGVLIVLPRAFDLDLQFGMPLPLRALFSLPMLSTAAAIGLVVLGIPLLRTSRRVTSGAVAYVAFTLVALAFVPFLGYWNLLGWRW